jgi:hypothetical protein
VRFASNPCDLTVVEVKCDRDAFPLATYVGILSSESYSAWDFWVTISASCFRYDPRLSEIFAELITDY